MNRTKKLLIRIFIVLYALSYFLQNSFFVDRKKVYAAVNPSTTNLVAVIVDKNIYDDIKTDLVRYTTKYIQKKIANSKAIVLPIDPSTLKAHEISQILENMYFEGLKNESSKLVGTILIGDVPLPVVQNNGFVYPSIYPYVDFEDQQFVYDTNKKFFVYNNNPNGQAELRHGIIQFDKITQYDDFFAKVRSYYNNPTQFIDKAIRYEDFIGLKKYFIPENTKYYVNNIVFSEDIGYHRFNGLLLNILNDEHNNSTVSLGTDLANGLQDTEDPELQAYAQDIKEREEQMKEGMNELNSSSNQGSSQEGEPSEAGMPTMTLKKATQEMLKGYDGLISTQLLSTIRDNVAGLARRYKNVGGNTAIDYSSLTDKIAQKDNRLLGDIDNEVQPLLIGINDFLEEKLNEKIADEKYYMQIPLQVSELEFEGDIKIPAAFRVYRVPLPKCVRKEYDYFENYYFGKNAKQIVSAQATSAYRGTYKNLTSTSGQIITKPLQSVGGSYDIFSTQVEANRGYNINSTKQELDIYAKHKINKQEVWKKDCNLHLFGYCMRRQKTRRADDSADEDKCIIDNEQKQGGCETMKDFTQRIRGGASPMNIDTATQTLTNYNYKDAILPIYDIAGSKKVDTPQPDANSYSGVITYTALIQRKFAVKEKQEQKYSKIDDFLANPTSNGIDIKFTNQIPNNTDLEHPNRVYNPPRVQKDFFTAFGTSEVPYNKTFGGKAILYDWTAATDIMKCNMRGKVYSYKLIDSRVMNTAPTWKQISDTEFPKFKDGSDLENFYNNVMTELSLIKDNILDTNVEFSGTDFNDITGTVANLAALKSIVTTANAGLLNINAFNVNLLPSYTGGQVANLNQQRINDNITQAKSDDIKTRIERVNKGLDTLQEYISELSANNVYLAFVDIIQSEAFKNQKVEILNTRKTNISQNFGYIVANVNKLKAMFIQARSIYNTIGQLQNMSSMLANKKNDVNNKQTCGTYPNTYSCGCTYNYQSLCVTLQNIKDTLDNNLSDITDKLDKIHSYQGENGTVQPFVEINQEFTLPNPKIFIEISQLTTMMNGFDISTDPDKKERNKGMNLTTQDRPIDNIRNITFKGVGGDFVRFDYPNLYEVNVYKQIGDKLVLKTVTEIREAIKQYLTEKTIKYNTLLQQQKEKRQPYFQQRSQQFTLLNQLNPLANPMNSIHDYDTIPEDYFINKVIEYLDTIENAPEYGKRAIYGISAATTINDKLDMLAKVLYYQNITWPERLAQTGVAQDIVQTKEAFDINAKISNIMNTYLVQDQNQGKIITPTYNDTGYEIAYINSDGDDYISSKSTPSFIQQIQNIQEKKTTPKKNAFIEPSSYTELQDEVDSCEGVDTDGTSLLFDFKTMSFPRFKAMKCRAKKIFKKPFDIQVGFKNAQGPVIVGMFEPIKESLEGRQTERKEYGSQRSAPNNEDTINNSPAAIKEVLNGYNNNAIVKLGKTIVGVEDTGNNNISIGMVQDMGLVRVKISGTGDNCFSIWKGRKNLSKNICKDKAEELYNPYNNDEYTFDIQLNGKTAGSTSLKIELCPPITAFKECIVKQHVVNILPADIAEIKVDTTTDIVMEGAALPLVVSAKDAYDNPIGQSLKAYTISVNSGDGLIYDGAASLASIKFDNFLKAGFIYQAPTNIQDNKDIIINIAPATIPEMKGSLIEEPKITPKVVQKKITVAKGIITVSQNNVVLYRTDTKQINKPKITYDLPKAEEDIQYTDTDGIAQINAGNVASIRIDIKDKNGVLLDTVANVTTAQGLLIPGTMTTKTIVQDNVNKQQIFFTPGNDFLVQTGKKEITLYPNFKAGTDTLTISIPGIDPIIIPIVVNAGPAKTVLLSLEKSRMDMTSMTGSQGTIHVVDTRNNKVTKPTTIKLGVIGAGTTNTNAFTYTGKQYTYTLTTKKPGGEGYVFAYIDGRPLADQFPGYERFIVQESILPKEKLNVMYLNLFGTDRGNQRGYFSENEKIVNTITRQSHKLLATTTELVDPTKIKQIEYIISPNGQIQSISDKEASIIVEDKKLIFQAPEITKITLGLAEDFKITKMENTGALADSEKDENMLIYIPEPTDSIITTNEATKSKITINGTDILDLNKGTMDPMLAISADNEFLQDMSSYTIKYNDKEIGKLMIWSKDDITTNIDLQDPITYGTTKIFSEGSTNTQGVGIYLIESAFTTQGYASIESSSDPLLGIGFTNNFMNISNFANGKTVGEATVPFGSHFLINFGDPLLERREKNPEIPDTDFDASNGQTIYADPTKTIYKVLPIDFNNDKVKDLIVVYTDGVIKLLKNYGGTNPYKNLQELMIIAEPIKDIQIGDVDGNDYEDIFIKTNTDKGIVYLNNKGIFAVDGKNVCLNINTEPDMINPEPEDFSTVSQFFVEDMDLDGKLDIVTKDTLEDIKIFYGGSTNRGANYLSSTTGGCDAERYERQKNNYKTIKRFGVKVNSSRYVQDGSLIHRKGGDIPMEGKEEEKEVEDGDTTAGMSQSQMSALKVQTLNDINTMVADNDKYIAAGAAQLAYTDNPLETAPAYESLAPEDIYYLPISEIHQDNDKIGVYKQFEDMNGKVLRKGDEVVVKVTIVSKIHANKLTYIDEMQGPRSIARDDDNKIPSLVFLEGSTGGLVMNRDAPEGYQFVIDNIHLNQNQVLSFSYKVRYEPQNTSVITIDVKDQDILKQNKFKDGTPDISISSTDACQKDRWILFNENTGNRRTYQEILEDLQSSINDYNSGATAKQREAINDLINQVGSTEDLEGVSDLPGMSNLETWSPKNMINTISSFGNSLISQGTVSLDTSFIDSALAGVSQKLNQALQGLCQGFTIGKAGGGCGVPVPFNQAFLAPGDYHIFGCVPKVPNPLYTVFRTLNNTLGKGMPVLFVPGYIPVGTPPYIPFIGSSFVPATFKGQGDGFFGFNVNTVPPLPGSQFRLYIAPTLTLGLGIAMCFGPYSVGKALPKPFRDMGGNCIVFAIPPATRACEDEGGGEEGETPKESFDANIASAARVGTCNNPPQIGSTTARKPNSINMSGTPEVIDVVTATSPLQAVSSFENTCESCETNYHPAIQEGDFGGIFSISNQDPIRVSADEDYGNATEQLEEGVTYEGYKLEKGEKINLKILGAKTKGLVKCVVQDWMTRQIKYVQNNLTKMTIQLDLPDMSTIFQGFDKIGNLEETYKSLNQQDKNEGYIKDTKGQGVDVLQNRTGGYISWTEKLSKQQLKNLSETIGENPFQAIQEIFKEVPLIQFESKDINMKIPMVTSDDINAYVNYLTLRMEKNQKILEDRTEMINQILAMCGTTSKSDAAAMKKKLETEKQTLEGDMSLTADEKSSLMSWVNSEIQDMDNILALKEDTTRQKMASDFKNIGVNAKNTALKIAKLPKRKILQLKLETKKKGFEKVGEKLDTNDQKRLDTINGIVGNLEKCAGAAGGLNDFLKFRENTAGLISSIKANIKVLEKYKQFPGQLYQRTHLTDRYLTEVSAMLSDFIGGINNFFSLNATRFSQYIDAIIILVGTIKTRQAIIDFSVNRSKKCSKCSNDNYGAFSCSLSFLCPKLPVLPIPPFKIPNIYMDLSHMDLGMNIVLPKINFVPMKVTLPQIPNLPEPPAIEVDRDVLYGLDLNFFEGMSLPTIPVIPEPPTVPEPPSFIPSIKMDLPILPPAPKIPKLPSEINVILKVADFIGKVFCIVKGGIGLVGEKGVKGKIEQITQRTWDVPIFDYFNLTNNFKTPPLKGFDYEMDAYTTLKFNFDGVYDVFNIIAQTSNGIVSKYVESNLQKAADRVTEKANNNDMTNIINQIENFDQSIKFNYNTNESGLADYRTVYDELKQGLITFKNTTITDKNMNDRVKSILATVENKSTVRPATEQIQQVEKTAKAIIDKKLKENEQVQQEIEEYDSFIEKLKGDKIVLVADDSTQATLTTPVLTIDAPSRNILQSQEDPTKTYLTLNKKMVQGYLDAVNNDGAEKLNMSETTYKKSKKYLEKTKEKIDQALLAYSDPDESTTVAQCTNCSSNDEGTSYSPDISAYVQGVFVESYSGSETSSTSTKAVVNTVASPKQIEEVKDKYVTDLDLNNDKKNDIYMYNANSIKIKYAAQESEHFSQGGNTLTTHYNDFYSYANEHPRNPYIKSLDQLRENTDTYGFMDIKDITIKVVDKNKETKNFKTSGQSFDNLQLSRTNSKPSGEEVDGYVIKLTTKVDEKDTPSSFRDFLGTEKNVSYILVLPIGTDYKKGLITIDKDTVKKPINIELGEKILAVEYFDPAQERVTMTLKNLPRKRLYTSIASLTITQEDLSNNQQKNFTLYKKSSPRSNQTVAGMQNLGDMEAPVGEFLLRRNLTQETVSSGVNHEGYINTNYTLKSIWTDNVLVKKMIIQQNGQTILEKDNDSQTGTLDLGPLFSTGVTQQSFDFIAIDQNDNIAKEVVTLSISIPDIEIIDLKKSGETTADIVAKISNDIDEGMVIFQRLRNGMRKDIAGSNQNAYGGFDLIPKQTIITGGIFTLGNEIGLYDSQGNEIATIDPETGEIKINQEYENTVKINLNFSTHIPVVELRDTTKNITLFQIVLPVESITKIQMNDGKPNYEMLQLPDGGFGDFNNGYCIKNIRNDCILYTNSIGAIYIPGVYASSLVGEYAFDETKKTTTFIVKDQSNKPITTLILKIRSTTP